MNVPKFKNLFEIYEYPFPQTRYQGSKLKLVDWIWEKIKDIKFETVLDAFGGTASISHKLKNKNKKVTYNDILKFNYIIGKGLIENTQYKITEYEVDFILKKDESINYPTFIYDNFKNIFYLDEENQWLDMIITNINRIENEYKKAILFFALFQSCIVKRPYNLFHRANLYVRTNDVERNFGNKTTWDTKFEKHFKNFIKEANNSIFNNGKECISINKDVFEIENKNFDLVYIDTPYISEKGIGTDYFDFYHFLEGITNYENWKDNIDYNYKHLPLLSNKQNTFIKKDLILNDFDRLFDKFKNSILVISYRNNGIPQISDIINLLKKYKNNIEIHSKEYKYVLAETKSTEILLIAK